MFNQVEYNIIHNYTNKVINDYYKNSYISKEKILFLQECSKKLKKTKNFLHITSSLDDILSTNNLLCSSGGLGGVLYVTPIDTNFKIHNLGKYILDTELPMFIKNNNLCKNINSLLINTPNNKVGYVDYLEFGQWYYYLYKKNYKIINQNIIEKKANTLYFQIEKIMNLSTNVNNINKIFNIMNNSNVLKIYFFECILEYLLLFQKKQNSNIIIDNSIAKNIIYKLCPSMATKFSLSNFTFCFENLNNIVKNSNLYEIKYIKEYIISRINFFIKKYLLNNKDNLYGQIIFRNFNLRKKLEFDFSKILWKEAEKQDYNILTYIIPKGEMGILPSPKNKVYKCEVKNNRCFTKNETNVKIIPLLVNSSIMRNPYCNKEDKMELPIKVQGVMYTKKNDKIEYLIIKRCQNDGGFWQGMTGTLEEGETLKECLKREIKEELGITNIKNISELKETIQWAKKTGFMITEYVYAVEINKDVNVILSEEHDDYKWCDFNEAYETLGKDNNKNTLKIINGELLNGKE